jgi:ABC-type multidrug transport system ATPase subunit
VTVSVTPALRFEGVRKRFGAIEALRGLDLAVPAGSLFGLVGPNGAGKTTAFSIACGFLQPDVGRVSLLGVDGYQVGKLKGRVTALPQDAALGRETRCLEHLRFLGQLQGLTVRAAREQGAQLLEDVGLGDRKDAKVKALSHGMLRRLQAAQALMGTPELVLLDEPTSGLDPRNAHELRELLRRWRVGRTILISSHNLHELEALCDHVAFIDHGVVVAAGTTETVTGRGQEIEIELGEGPAPIEAVVAALAGDRVAWDGTRRVLEIEFEPREGHAAEDVIGAALRVLLDAGARVGGVRRGGTLERKFLEMT